MTDDDTEMDDDDNILDFETERERKRRKPKPKPAAPPPQSLAEKAATHFRALGYDGDQFFFLASSSGQVHSLTASRLGRKPDLFTLAPIIWWELEFCDGEGFSGRRVDAAVSALIQLCHQQGVFRHDRRRGRGVWRDGQDLVIHAGDRLYVNGQPTDLLTIKTDALYERKTAIPLAWDDPLPASQARKVLELGSKLNFEVSSHGRLWAGWIAVSLVSGALAWRPHILLTGPKGCGKTSVVEIMARLLGAFRMSTTGGTTAAGLRQSLASEAMPVIFDEAEGDSQHAAQNIADVLALMRHSSAGFDAQVIKGGADGKAVASTVQSCFCLAAIRDPLHQAADKSRVTLLTLRGATELSGDLWDREVAPFAKEVCQDAFVTRLHARILTRLPMLMASIAVFRDVGRHFFKESRMADQIGTLLAGAWLLEHDQAPTPDQAREEYETLNFEEQEELLADSSDEADCLRAILEAHVKVDGAEWHGDASFAELIEFLQKSSMTPLDKPTGPGGISEREAERALALYGIRVETDSTGRATGRVLISNSNGMLARKIMAHTAWPKGWGKLLARLPGAEKPSAPIWLGGQVTRVVSVIVEPKASK